MLLFSDSRFQIAGNSELKEKTFRLLHIFPFAKVFIFNILQNKY